MAGTKRTKRATKRSAESDQPRVRARYWERRAEVKEHQVRRSQAALAFVLGAVLSMKGREYMDELEAEAGRAALKLWPVLEDEVVGDLAEG